MVIHRPETGLFTDNNKTYSFSVWHTVTSYILSYKSSDKSCSPVNPTSIDV